MNNSKDWDPAHYLKYGNERTQPSIDLVNRIAINSMPEHILDMGCGPGNSTHILRQRWPESRLTGIDNSHSMIEKAKNDYPGEEWILSDAAGFITDIKFDIIFSNAAIQWMPDHKNLLDKLYNMLSDNGVIAIQIPEFEDMILGRIISSVSGRERWKKKTGKCSELFTYHDSHYYYDVLADKMKLVDMWETDYIHVMASHQSIIDWIKSTGMKPYLDSLSDENDKIDFENEVLIEVEKSYPLKLNGKVLFPFKRLFFIAYK